MNKVAWIRSITKRLLGEYTTLKRLRRESDDAPIPIWGRYATL